MKTNASLMPVCVLIVLKENEMISINSAKGQFIDTEATNKLPSLQCLICVDREVEGKLQTLPIIPQHHYKEWTGCFSIIH